MEKSFHFVDTSVEVDRVARKSMRSHVMRGKNAGKTVHRRSRLELGGAVRTTFGDASLLHEEAGRRNAETLGPVVRNLGNVLRTFRFPVELSQSALKSIDLCKYGIRVMDQLGVAAETSLF